MPQGVPSFAKIPAPTQPPAAAGVFEAETGRPASLEGFFHERQANFVFFWAPAGASGVAFKKMTGSRSFVGM